MRRTRARRPNAPKILYSIFLGGSDYDGGLAIAVDSKGSAYVYGTTSSANFPVTPGAVQGKFGGGFEDAFLAKLNATGDALVYATYLGGNDAEFAAAVAVDADGNAYVTGSTSSQNFPTVAGSYKTTFTGCQKAFISKVNATGSALVYSTLLGGSAQERPSAIVLDSAGNAYVTGTTKSPDYPTTTNAYQTTRKGPSDAFVTKLNPAGSALVFSTLLGGSGDDTALSIALPTPIPNPNPLPSPAPSPSPSPSPKPLWIGGSTNGQADFPTVQPPQACSAAICPRGACNSGTVSLLAADGSSLLFSTCVGAAGHDVIVNGIATYGKTLTVRLFSDPGQVRPLRALVVRPRGTSSIAIDARLPRCRNCHA